VRDTPVRFVQARLESLERYNFQQRLYPAPETQAIWTDALKANLDADQTAAAKKSAGERETFRNESISAFVVAMLDQAHHLTTAQQAKLTTAVTGVVKEYEPDIQSYFSMNYSQAWYFQSYTMFLPVVAIPETELKSIMGPECFAQFSGSQQYGNAMSNFSGLKQNHDNRVRVAAAAKKK
jgi:hypothetical protein